MAEKNQGRAPVKVVIDLSEEDYSFFKAQPGETETPLGRLYGAIQNGVTLPIHHGRLGDLDALEANMEGGIKAGMCEEGYEKFGNINDVDDCLECVRFADTIIPAEKGVTENV